MKLFATIGLLLLFTACNRHSPAAATAPSSTPTVAYVASSHSKVFHRPTCRWAEKISPGNLVTFASREDAVKAGLRPCKTCRP